MSTQEILALEWEMFVAVQDPRGRATCQEDYQGFVVMRKSQLLAFDSALQRSYLTDLQAAKAAGRNLMAEKYAHMMAYTAPEDYARVAASLPTPEPEAVSLIAEILPKQMQQTAQFRAQFPRLAGRGRMQSATADSATETSAETYLRGELLTYSISTLKLYQDMLDRYAETEMNYVANVMTHTVQLRGYADLREAEESI